MTAYSLDLADIHHAINVSSDDHSVVKVGPLNVLHATEVVELAANGVDIGLHVCSIVRAATGGRFVIYLYEDDS